MNDNKIFMTSVAGINFRATEDDCGPIIGYVERDLNNEYDPRAVGVYKPNGELLGFIASKNLDDFYKFKGEGFDKMVYAGNIKSSKRYGKTFFICDIAIIRSEDEEELSEIVNNFLFNEEFNLYGKTKQTGWNQETM